MASVALPLFYYLLYADHRRRLNKVVTSPEDFRQGLFCLAFAKGLARRKQKIGRAIEMLGATWGWCVEALVIYTFWCGAGCCLYRWLLIFKSELFLIRSVK